MSRGRAYEVRSCRVYKHDGSVHVMQDDGTTKHYLPEAGVRVLRGRSMNDARMSVQAMREHLARVSYQPGCRLEIRECPFEGPYLWIVATTQDTTNPDTTIDLGVQTFIPPMRTLGQFNDFIEHRLRRLAVHEHLEWLRLDGEPLYDPHDPVWRGETA